MISSSNFGSLNGKKRFTANIIHPNSAIDTIHIDEEAPFMDMADLFVNTLGSATGMTRKFSTIFTKNIIQCKIYVDDAFGIDIVMDGANTDELFSPKQKVYNMLASLIVENGTRLYGPVVVVAETPNGDHVNISRAKHFKDWIKNAKNLNI